MLFYLGRQAVISLPGLQPAQVCAYMRNYFPFYVDFTVDHPRVTRSHFFTDPMIYNLTNPTNSP